MEKQTKPQKHYIQVWIESEKDLPKEQDYYSVHFSGSPKNKTDCIIFTKDSIINPSAWNVVDWYLKPIPDETAKYKELLGVYRECHKYLMNYFGSNKTPTIKKFERKMAALEKELK